MASGSLVSFDLPISDLLPACTSNDTSSHRKQPVLARTASISMALSCSQEQVPLERTSGGGIFTAEAAGEKEDRRAKFGASSRRSALESRLIRVHKS
jgi:hypothetical protein